LAVPLILYRCGVDDSGNTFSEQRHVEVDQ
jgi:hypothetical protein